MVKELRTATIIMPVFNGASFLKDSIGSVFAQTYGSIELITVNDGSRDNSLCVLEELRKECPPSVDMHVISQDNQGICASRNRALDLATGDYVLFLDQDDRLLKNSVRTLVRILESHKSDMVIGGYKLVDEKGRVLEKWKLNSELPWCKYRISAPWGRIFRRSIIEDNHIRFMQTRISEDFYFNLVYMSCCRKIYVTPYIGYAWTYRKASESHRNMSVMDPGRNPLVMMSQVLRDMKQPNNLEKDLLDYMFIKHIVWYLLYTARGASPDDLRRSCDDCFSWLDEHVPAYKHREKIVLRGPEGETVKVRTIVRAVVTLKKTGLLYPVLRLYAKL